MRDMHGMQTTRYVPNGVGTSCRRRERATMSASNAAPTSASPAGSGAAATTTGVTSTHGAVVRQNVAGWLALPMLYRNNASAPVGSAVGNVAPVVGFTRKSA